MKIEKPWRLISGLFPVVKWSRKYDLETGVGDLIAGITIALTLIPQSIAYASLAGLEAQYGLYASFAGGFVYAVMGTCPQINIGPTALLSLLTATYTSGTNADFAVLLCFFAGVVQLIAGITQLGFLVDLVSLPVVSGFTSAAAITIASSQIKGLLGLHFSGESFVTIWQGVFQHIGETRMPDTLLSLSCCIILIGMKALKDLTFKESKDDKYLRTKRIVQKCLWFAGVGRNAVVVILAAVAAYFVYEDRENPLILTGRITPGLPTPQPPPFHTEVRNTTYNSSEMLSHLGSGLLVVPLVGIIANVAIAKAFSSGSTLDATQEIIALGVCNLVGSFFRSLPVNGSFSRSAVSHASGVRTPAAGIYTGVIVLLTLGLLTPYFFFIPRAALASVIVCAVLQMVDISIIKKLWTSNKLDIIPLVGTFACCLGVGVEMGLVCGVGFDILLLLYYSARPPLEIQLVTDNGLPPHFAARPYGGLHFVAAERVRAALSSLRTPDNNDKNLSALEAPVIVPETNGVSNGRITNALFRNEGGLFGNQVAINVLDAATKSVNTLVVYCEGLHRLDYTFLQSIKMLVSEWSRDGRVIWCGAQPQLKAQLSSVIQDAVFCDQESLPYLLNGTTVIPVQAATTVTPL